MQDWQLLQEFVKNGSQAAFGQLVERHLNFVYSTCLRELGDCGLAEDATQVVFLLLSQKASTLKPGIVLTGWLFQTARLVAKNTRKQEVRWRARNRKAAEAMIHEAKTLPSIDAMPGTEEDAWTQIKPLLNDAMEGLSTLDRNAVLLRCFEGHSLRATGEALGLTEEAARKRISRALEKLRRYFTHHGVTLSAVTLTGLLTGHAVQVAPAGLAASTVAMTGAAIPAALSVATSSTATASLSAGSAVSGKALVLAELAENVKRAWLLVKIKTAATAVCGVSLAAAGTEQIVRHTHTPPLRPQVTQATQQNRGKARRELAVLPQTQSAPVKAGVPMLEAEQNQPDAGPIQEAPGGAQSDSSPENVTKEVVTREQKISPRANERNEAMQVKKTVAATILKTTMVAGALTASVLPAVAQPDVKQPGMAGDKPKATGQLGNDAQIRATLVMGRGIPGMGGGGMPGTSGGMINGQMNIEMLRTSLQIQGVTDEATVNAIFEHVKRVDEARQALNKKAEPVRAGMAPNTALADTQFNVLFNEYQGAIEDYKAARENSARQLDEKIGYSKKARLHATLMTLGIVGDAPQDGQNLGNRAFELYTTLQKAPVFLNAAPGAMAIPGGLWGGKAVPGAPGGFEGAAGGFEGGPGAGAGFGGAGAGFGGAGAGFGGAGAGFGGAPGAGFAGAPPQPGAPAQAFEFQVAPNGDQFVNVFANPPVAVNVDALAKVPPTPATNEQIEALRRDLDAQIKALREEMERLKAGTKAQAEKKAPTETGKP